MSTTFSVPVGNLSQAETLHLQRLVVFRDAVAQELIHIKDRDVLVAACDRQINFDTRLQPEDQPLRIKFTNNDETIYGLTEYHAYVLTHYEVRTGFMIWFPTARLEDVIDVPDHSGCRLLPSKDDPNVFTCATGITKMARVPKTMKYMSMMERQRMTQLDVYNFRIYAKSFKPESLNKYIADMVDAEIDLYDPRKPHDKSRLYKAMRFDIGRGQAPSLFVYIASYCVRLGSNTKELDIELVKHNCEFYKSLWLYFDAKRQVMRPSEGQSFEITYLPEPRCSLIITNFMKNFIPDDDPGVAKVN